jgi:hypothetical protein
MFLLNPIVKSMILLHPSWNQICLFYLNPNGKLRQNLKVRDQKNKRIATDTPAVPFMRQPIIHHQMPQPDHEAQHPNEVHEFPIDLPNNDVQLPEGDQILEPQQHMPNEQQLDQPAMAEQPVRRSTRQRRQPVRFQDYIPIDQAAMPTFVEPSLEEYNNNIKIYCSQPNYLKDKEQLQPNAWNVVRSGIIPLDNSLLYIYSTHGGYL